MVIIVRIIRNSKENSYGNDYEYMSSKKELMKKLISGK